MPLNVEHIEADLAVIGFGKGGKTLAAALGRQGRRVVMIEQSALMYGGTCINIGCVPTKSMVYRAEHLTPGGVYEDAYRSAVAATADLTADLRAVNFAMLDNLDTVTVLTGHARFTDPHTLQVETVGGATVTVVAQSIVIGTGSRPVLPDIPGLSTTPQVMTSTELLSLPELPGLLTVLGGGYVGLEFAAMFARYGSEVTVLEHGPRILGREDADVAACLHDILSSRGVEIVTAAEVTSVTEARQAAWVTFQADRMQHAVEADAVLVALGREPVTDDLGLAEAGVETTGARAIVVDEYLRTSQPHIFAVGDVNGGPQFTYISLDDYRVVLSQLAGDGSRSTASRTAVPYVLFTSPPLARVGLTEAAAVAAGMDILVATLPVAAMATVPRARIVDETAGLMKVVVDAGTDKILGAALLSYDSHEVINTVALAMRHGITATELRDTIYTHPSMTEAFNQLLGALAAPSS
ncbi:FAD-dependent oxidoreductase [Mycolicibacterium aichiense]|uniref:Pyridine nucleotide-disulfide oxidoreductase n=1 Tax=Mycolicibacterium aichiense TaxID=1799 RepID=A0AAD1MAE7_9MYCO|nr:FAD-dependent oxidoreductase [Mycolicibacterium aichiense]MCV7019153.1 NAD(P)/FAD-dependent oxidoreductase [Mycolicibacterium aichiense]BBX06303.1 pyridine nucleotide-disulfide oxidoreductase [Mycolicibacterium aichiense]STZ24355.1 pyruvate/2-oxoglutarate dehydrogenase complex, dihydrolipoamide dehydrogenase component [Mycolicibacterium aichiense]